MTDLIDRNAILEELRESYKAALRKAVGGYRIAIGLESAIDIVKGASAVDAEPVKHGKWEPVSTVCNHTHEFRCSACKVSVFYVNYIRFCDYNYCPNCGVKMDEERGHG